MILFFILAFTILVVSINTKISSQQQQAFTISDGRIIVDNVISDSQLETLVEIIRHEPELLKKRPAMIKPQNNHTDGSKTNILAKQAVLFSFQFLPKLETYITSPHKIERMKKDIKDLEMNVISHCESFYNVKVISHDTSIVSRAHIKVDRDYERSPSTINNRSGWLLRIHSDTCEFRASDWSCETYNFANDYGQVKASRYPMTHLSAVVFINDLELQSGGNLVFIDPLSRENIYHRHHIQHHSGINKFPGNNQKSPNSSSANNLDVSSTTAVLRDMNISTDPTPYIRYLDAPHWEDDIMPPVRYTVVLPRARRLVVWNSSGDHIHGITQMLNEGGHRFTFFLFMTVEKR